MATPNCRYRPAFLQLFTREPGHSLLSDIGSGLTVGVIALPLAIGFGIASGATPAQGLWTAIIAGFIISAMGGSRYQIGGPTGAFVPVLAGIAASAGYEGLVVATLMAGVMLVIMGLLRAGAILRYIPYPVIAGFTTGIAVIIFLGQVPEFLGLGFAKPAHTVDLLMEILRRAGDTRWPALLTGVLGLLIVFLWPKVTTRIPGAIVAVAGLTLLVHAAGWEVATIRSKFGELPPGLPGWHVPEISLDTLRRLMGPAFTIAALGAIESLLSATVADGMTDSRHDANSELIGQGLANIAAPLAGGFASTGAIARTAANIRSGARTPLSGMVHALSLMGFVLFAAPWVGYIPLAALSAVLMGVAIRMAEWDTFGEVRRASRSDFLVMAATFGLTVVFDLTVGVAGGLILAVGLFVRRMEQVSGVQAQTPETGPDGGLRGRSLPEGVVLFRFEGPLFFAAVEKLEFALKNHGGKPRAVIFRLRHVPAMDTTALHALEVAVEKMQRDGVAVLLTGVQPQPLRVLQRSGLAETIGPENFCAGLEEALERCRGLPPV